MLRPTGSESDSSRTPSLDQFLRILAGIGFDEAGLRLLLSGFQGGFLLRLSFQVCSPALALRFRVCIFGKALGFRVCSGEVLGFNFRKIFRF